MTDGSEGENARARANGGAPRHDDVARELDAVGEATFSPTTQKGPMRTPPRSGRRPRRLRSDGYVLSHLLAANARASAVFASIGADLRLGDGLSVDLCLPEETPYATAIAHLADMIVQLVTWKYGFAELGAIYAHEVDELGF